MNESVEALTLPLLVLGAGAILAVALTAFAGRYALPVPGLLLGVGLLLNSDTPSVPVLGIDSVAQLGTVALVLILFEGGFSGGWLRARASLGPILALGLPGTLLTCGLLAAAAHYVVGLGWETSLLIAIALAPTDPAAVFSVLGSRDVNGRSSAILEGESGANDPVGIALMVGALEYVNGDGSAAAMAGDFALELLVGAGVGAVLGWAFGRALRDTRLRVESLYPVIALACALVVYSLAVTLHGSGFLAVLVAGLLMGDALRSQRSVHSVVGLGAALAEVAMFTALGLTVDLPALADNIGAGLALFAVLTFVIRPVVTCGLLFPAQLTWPERGFISWGGLKGAVPVLLAAFAVLDGVDERTTIYSIVFVAVTASIALQGSTIPHLAFRLGLLAEDEDPPTAQAASSRSSGSR